MHERMLAPEVHLGRAVESYCYSTSTVLDLDCTMSPSAVCPGKRLPFVRLSMDETWLPNL